MEQAEIHGQTGLRWVISLYCNFATFREDQMFIQTISCRFNTPFVLKWTRCVHNVRYSRKNRLRWFPCLFQHLVVILQVILYVSVTECNWYVNIVFFKYEHNMAEFILKSLPSRCHRCAPCCAGSGYSNRGCLLQSWTLTTNTPVFILSREAWTKLYGYLKKSHWLGTLSYDIMVHLYWQSHLHWHQIFQV